MDARCSEIDVCKEVLYEHEQVLLHPTKTYPITRNLKHSTHKLGTRSGFLTNAKLTSSLVTLVALTSLQARRVQPLLATWYLTVFLVSRVIYTNATIMLQVREVGQGVSGHSQWNSAISFLRYWAPWKKLTECVSLPRSSQEALYQATWVDSYIQWFV